MMKLRDFRGRFEGETVLLVSAGQTTLDYHQLAGRYRFVVLINRAIRLAELFQASGAEVFFVSVHPEIFGPDPVLELPQVTACFPAHGQQACSPAVRDSAIWFAVEDGQVYDPEAFRERVNDVEQAFTLNRLCAICNSAHVTLHLIYTLGCRNLHVVGAHEYRGVPTRGYDPRLWHEESPVASEAYIKAFRDWAGLFTWNVEYLGD